MRVLVDCALHEVPWNPYYGHLAARLAAASKNHRVRGRGRAGASRNRAAACL